jgi:hypothetical protein
LVEKAREMEDRQKVQMEKWNEASELYQLTLQSLVASHEKEERMANDNKEALEKKVQEMAKELDELKQRKKRRSEVTPRIISLADSLFRSIIKKWPNWRSCRNNSPTTRNCVERWSNSKNRKMGWKRAASAWCAWKSPLHRVRNQGCFLCD